MGCSAHKESVPKNIEEIHECAADDLCNPEYEIHRRQEYGNSEKTVYDEFVYLLRKKDLIRHSSYNILHEARDDSVARFGKNDIWRIAKNVRTALDRPVNDFACHIAMAHYLAADERIAFNGLERNPARIHLEMLSCLDGGRRENIYFLLKLVRELNMDTRHLGRGNCLVKETAELCHILRLCGGNADYGNSKVLREVAEINSDSALPCHIHHRHHDDHRHLKLAHEKRQIKVALDRGGVKNVYVDIGLMRKNILERCLFVLARGSKRINTGKIHDFRLAELRKNSFTLLLLHRNAWPIADMLIGTSKAVEKSGLSAVRIANKSNSLHLLFPASKRFTLITLTSSFRKER